MDYTALVNQQSKSQPQTLEAVQVELLAPEPGEGKPELRPFRMLANTGSVVQRMFGKAVFDLSGIEHGSKTPILLDHDPSKRVAFADTHKLTADGLELSGYLLQNPDAQQLGQDSDDGFPFQASVGLLVSSWEELGEDGTAEVNGVELSGPLSIARQSRLLESSFLMAGADHKTHAVALAAANTKEAHMTPDEFLAAHPNVVAGWKDEGKTDARKEAGEFLAAFPGREAWAAAQFTSGATLLEARAALADVLAEELKTVKAEKVEEKTLATLAAKVGVGFDGEAHEANRPTVDTLWSDPSIQAEFAGNRSAFLSAVSRGLVPELKG